MKTIMPHGDEHWTHRTPRNVMRGEAHPFAKLTESDVREIRRRYSVGNVTQEALAIEFGVRSVWHILKGKSWEHVK
jgi:hypothetical protein